MVTLYAGMREMVVTMLEWLVHLLSHPLALPLLGGLLLLLLAVGLARRPRRSEGYAFSQAWERGAPPPEPLPEPPLSGRAPLA